MSELVWQVGGRAILERTRATGLAATLLMSAWPLVGAACGAEGVPAVFGYCEDVRRESYSSEEPWDGPEAAGAREHCAFDPGAHASQSLPGAPAISPQLEHVIIILRENRSFDHLLGEYRPVGDQQLVDPLDPAQAWNPDPSAPRRGERAPRFHEQFYCTDNPSHEWGDVHLQFNNGHLDGFVAASNFRSPRNDGGCLAMGYYDRSDLPLYYWLAENFAISDRYFSSLLGSTLPNVMFYYYASSCGTADNVETLVDVDILAVCGGARTIFDLLDEGGVSYAVYGDSVPAQVSSAVGLAHYPPLAVRSIHLSLRG